MVGAVEALQALTTTARFDLTIMMLDSKTRKGNMATDQWFTMSQLNFVHSLTKSTYKPYSGEGGL